MNHARIPQDVLDQAAELRRLVGRRFRRARGEFSQREFAYLVGTTPGTLCAVERGERWPTPEIVCAVAARAGASVGSFYRTRHARVDTATRPVVVGGA